MKLQTNISGISLPRAQGDFMRDTVSRIRPSYLITAGVLVFFALSFAIFAYSFPSQSKVATKTASASAAVHPMALAAATSLPVLEIHIANNGLTLVRDARIVEMRGSTMVVSSAWGSQEFKWIVLTDASTFENRTFGTRFWSRDNKPISLQDLKVGDRVTVTGMLVTTSNDPTIDASAVRSVE